MSAKELPWKKRTRQPQRPDGRECLQLEQLRLHSGASPVDVALDDVPTFSDRKTRVIADDQGTDPLFVLEEHSPFRPHST